VRGEQVKEVWLLGEQEGYEVVVVQPQTSDPQVGVSEELPGELPGELRGCRVVEVMDGPRGVVATRSPHLFGCLLVDVLEAALLVF
jgi:hypothetical protein